MNDDARFDENALPRLGRMIGEDVLREVLDLYFESLPKRMTILRDGLSSGDLEASARALHDIKSSAGMVGAVGVQELAGKMERLARDGDTEGLGERVERLSSALDAVGETLACARKRREA